jgi:endonuclease YncB( thermonuclease family)
MTVGSARRTSTTCAAARLQRGRNVRSPGRQTVLVLASSVALLAAAPAPIEGLAQRRSDPVQVRRVINGTAIEVVGIGRVRLLGIQVPTRGAPGAGRTPATEAALRLSGLIANRWVRLEFETKSTGAAYVFLDDGRFVNEWLVREGLARVSASGRSRLRRVDELLAAESAARAAGRGFWGDERAR